MRQADEDEDDALDDSTPLRDGTRGDDEEVDRLDPDPGSRRTTERLIRDLDREGLFGW